MASDVGVGDAEVASLVVAPADGTTGVTLTVNPPTGAPYDVTMTGGVLVEIPDTSPQQFSQRWTADTPVVYDQPSKWVLHFDVDGTGEGEEDLEVYVVASPVAGGPTWTPGRSRVANYVPHRTLVRSTTSVVESQDTYELTFDGSTVPPGIQVDRLIADGVAWVTSRAYPLNTRVWELAAVVAATFAAAAVERGWPQDDSSLPRANDLEKRMDLLWKDLIAANDKANTDDGVNNPSAVLPRWSFPHADCRYDNASYW